MRIGVISDSHGDRKALKGAVEAMGDVAVIFHLGDYVDDGLEVQHLKNTVK